MITLTKTGLGYLIEVTDEPTGIKQDPLAVTLEELVRLQGLIALERG